MMGIAEALHPSYAAILKVLGNSRINIHIFSFSSSSKSIFKPFNLGAHHQHRIKTTGRRIAQRRDVLLSRRHNTALFVSANTCGGTAKIIILAQPYFNKNQRIAVSHDEIDFAKPRPKIAFNQTKTVRNQISFRSAFSIIANLFFAE
jgi:hypothetical protein